MSSSSTDPQNAPMTYQERQEAQKARSVAVARGFCESLGDPEEKALLLVAGIKHRRADDVQKMDTRGAMRQHPGDLVMDVWRSIPVGARTLELEGGNFSPENLTLAEEGKKKDSARRRLDLEAQLDAGDHYLGHELLLVALAESIRSDLPSAMAKPDRLDVAAGGTTIEVPKDVMEDVVAAAYQLADDGLREGLDVRALAQQATEMWQTPAAPELV